jgi:hypothetical protein
MFNILVADSMENELNHLIFLLEDYKANNPEFDEIINIIDADNYDDAKEIVERENIDILFISTDMDKIAFHAYKKSNRTLIISIGESYNRLKKWYIDHIRKPILKTLFHLKFRSYLDILFFKKTGINSFIKVSTYDLSLISNLHVFWENHFTTRSNINEIIHIIYSLGIYQIDKGVESIIEVLETEKDISFIFKTEVHNDLIQHLDKIRRGFHFEMDGNHLTFQAFFDDSSFDELLGEYEDFALEYLSYDKLEILNSFLLEHDIANEESLKKLESKLGSDSSMEIIRKHVDRKNHKASTKFSFMDREDLEIFGMELEKFEELLINVEDKQFSPVELSIMVDFFGNISKTLIVYPSTKDISYKLRELCDALLTNGDLIRDDKKTLFTKVNSLIEHLDDWHRALSYRGNDSSDDLKDREIIPIINSILE